MAEVSKKMIVMEFTKIADYVSYIEDTKSDKSRLFRGYGMAKYKLLPTLYRKENSKVEELRQVEFEMIKRFRLRSIPFLGEKFLDDDLYMLFYMQHYGMPTRLLDWSESPYVALYFALNSKSNQDGVKFKESAVIWVLDPELWNFTALGVDPSPGLVNWPDPEMLPGYVGNSNRRTKTYGKSDPVALGGIYNNPRIVAQQGAFTLFGADIKPMEEIFETKSYAPESLVKILIPKDNIDAMRTSLTRLGITTSAIYPDMHGLAEEITAYFGF